MKSKKPSRHEMLSSCADVGPDDGLDPRAFFRKPSAGVPNRKALQLCRQAAQTLGQILAGECGDDLLRELIVESVQPAPNASRLLVTVALALSAAGVDPSEVLACLNRAHGRLRSEVAAAINRRKAPDLVFRVATPKA